jgi:hypothetical protein
MPGEAAAVPLDAAGADGLVGLAVTVTVAGVVGELADDEQPATAAMPMNAAAMASLPAPEFGERPAFESTGLENTDMPFTRVAPGTAFAIMTTMRSFWLAPHRRRSPGRR